MEEHKNSAKGPDLDNTIVIAQVFQEYINVVTKNVIREAKKHIFYNIASFLKRLEKDVYDQIFEDNYLGRQPLRRDKNPFGVGSVGQGEKRRSAPGLFKKHRSETSVAADIVLNAEKKEKKGIIASVFRHFEMRGKGKVTQPLEWAEAAVEHYWLPMDDNTVKKDLNLFVVTDLLFKLMEFAELGLPSLIHCKSGIGRSANIELMHVCHRYLRGHKEVVDRLDELYVPSKFVLMRSSQNNVGNTEVTLSDYMKNENIALSSRLEQLISCAARHIDGERHIVHLGKERQEYCLEVLEYLHPIIKAGKDNMESRPPNYRFIADLVQSIAFKNLIIDLGTVNMSTGQRAKDVKAFFQRLMHNDEGWYSELKNAANQKDNKKGFLTHYVDCHPLGKTADQHIKGNARRQQLVIVLQCTVDKLAVKYSGSCYAKTVNAKEVKKSNGKNNATKEANKRIKRNSVKLPRHEAAHNGQNRFVGGDNYANNNNNNAIQMVEMNNVNKKQADVMNELSEKLEAKETPGFSFVSE